MSGENLCQCGADKSECDTLIDVYTPFLQVIGGRKYRLLFENVARQILLSDGSNVETRLKTLERALSAFSTTRFAENIYMRDTFNSQVVEGDRCYVFDASDDENVGKGGAMYLWHDGAWQLLYDGDVPLDVNSIIGENAGLKIVDGRLAVDLDALLLAIAGNGLQESGGKLDVDLEALLAASAAMQEMNGKLDALEKLAMQNFAPNDEVWITESGEWEAPFDGIYGITCIGGGGGALVHTGQGHCQTGSSGAYVTKDVYLAKGETISVTIGAGGIGGASVSGDSPSLPGGDTSFGNLVTTSGSARRFGTLGVNVLNNSNNTANAVTHFSGSGFGGVVGDGIYYGASGGASLQINTSGAVTDRIVGNGAQGAIHIRFFNPAKASQPVINQGE